ncbi:hypothetical protein NK8_41760 [Caballeronia sp. NK8]|uniref:Imm70 family immunity protein n=1 Tax=Caballeronia sp. NK8 TaxID=140098 RepID=UPI001BB64EC7|nr:Imm70 family immunity protein [Caballeronia sp. NK8]BCQ25992.1 hypothetical protein NK8_41760 [Caballeronia sp. NK8]
MTIGIRTASIVTEIGAASFLNAFFSTVQGLLEQAGRGSRFPVISIDFYDGMVPSSKIKIALEELAEIQKELSKYSPSSIIWDIDDRTKEPPWGDDISEDITSLSNYFVTSTGRDLFETFLEIFRFAEKKECSVLIEKI